MNTNRDPSVIKSVPREYYAIQVPKQIISQKIREQLKEKELSYRKAAELLKKEMNMNYSQFSRITCGENYTIDNLLKALDILDLEIVIKEKEYI